MKRITITTRGYRMPDHLHPSLVSGLVLYFVLLCCSGLGGDRILFPGITRTQWVTMHNNSSLIFAALFIIHLVLQSSFNPIKTNP